MSWTPKLGEKVTSPLLVGEWEVVRSEAVIVWLAHSNGAAVSINREHVSPVAPPIPAEPPVGSVGRVDGKWFVEHRETGWRTTAGIKQDWPDFAAYYEPWMAVSQVADWLRTQALGISLVKEFVERFGWPDE